MSSMHLSGTDDHRQRIVRYWWMLELFSPQRVPKVTSRAAGAPDRQVVAWRPEDPLPWEVLSPPANVGGARRVWQHTVYLGVYDLEATYAYLQGAFGKDKDAYDEPASGRSACAGLLVDSRGSMVADSVVLSSALWAVGRISMPGVGDSSWADGFPEAAQVLREVIDEYQGSRREPAGADVPPALDGQTVTTLMCRAQEAAGIAQVPELATDTVIIQSVAVSAQRGDDANDIDFLNSFFLEDLATVREALARPHGSGEALRTYLTGDHELDGRSRVDVIRTDEATDTAVGPGRIPRGRWPSNPGHGLSLRQQFAVNQAMVDLSPGAGLMGVNGPPGTGKTTMLRDILAGNVVERARRIAALPRPESAFTSTTHRWTAKDGHARSVRQLLPELTGFEMVVASANNAAVENVTTEIPARGEIHERWREEADYFGDIATALLAETETQKDASSPPTVAWGLVAARLGNKRNRSAFHSAFWFDKKDAGSKEPAPGSVPRMQTRLARWRDGTEPRKSWADAQRDFARADRRVGDLLAGRRQAQERLRQLPGAIDADRRCAEVVALMRSQVRAVHDRLDVCRAESTRADGATRAAEDSRERHMDVRPGIWETIFTLGRAARDWRAALGPLEQDLLAAEAASREVEARARGLEDHAVTLQRSRASAENEQREASNALSELRRAVAADKAALGEGYPDESWTDDAREKRAPWLDAELDAARSDLFLAALKLHEDFLANTAADMSHGLRAALDVVAGTCPRRLEPEKRRAAWQLFFLVVPLISTTFASFGRMFGDIGPESIGWLLVDEAGQASPQYAAGAIWRARRVVAVGDPLQLQPVVTIPQKAQRDIATAYGVSDSWIPPQASVQTLADRVSRLGTTLQQADRQVWVSAPLTVHRRCDDPMFTLCNEIAYNGIMVNGVERRLDDPKEPDLFDSSEGPLVVESHWVDEPALTPGSHLQENQIVRLEKALRYLQDRGVPLGDVIAISPFRAVADRLAALARTYPGLSAGTIHTAQGREASVVFLVLGGDPASPGAKAWAASTVNLVNVAASRAKRRLFVIGDREAWARHNYFQQLAASLASPRRAETADA